VPKLACRACGRDVYAAAPFESLFAEEKRCPRCGASLAPDRRELERRQRIRRLNPPSDPGPPVAAGERRFHERRTARRRRGDGRSSRV